MESIFIAFLLMRFSVLDLDSIVRAGTARNLIRVLDALESKKGGLTLRGQ